MKAILNGTTLKISAETEQEGKDLQAWLDRNIGREGDMEFDVDSEYIFCGDCKYMKIEVNNEVYCNNPEYMHHKSRLITDINASLPNCPL